MRLPSSLALLLAGLIAIPAVHAQATRVYQWKDAQGVTHFSDQPPPMQVQKRKVSNDTHGLVAPVAAAKPAENPQCTTAKGNLAILASSSAVRQDTDGDGKPDVTLDDQGRANQKALAEAAVKAYCKPVAAPAT